MTSTSSKDISVAIRLESPAPLGTTVQPVTTGLPFAKGLLRGDEPLCLRDPNGGLRPVETEVLTRWSDGSAKWLLVAFLLDETFAGQSSCELRLERGAPPDLANHVRVEESAGGLTVNTGVATWRIDPREPALLMQDAGAFHVVLTDRRGQKLRPRWSAVRVESCGAIHASVLLEGQFPGKRGLRLVARLGFFAGTGLVRTRLTLHNPARASHPGGLWDLGDPGSCLFNDLSLEWTDGDGVKEGLWKAEVDLPSQSLPGATWQLYQGSSGGENWQSRNHVNASGEVTCKFRGYQVQATGVQEHGLRASPVLALRSDTGSLTVAVPEFWQQFPKTLETTGRGLRVGLFPQEWGEPFELQGGEQKTHTVWFLVEPGAAESLNQLDWVYRPVHAVASPEWYAASGALPYLLPNDRDPDERLRVLMDAAVRGDQSLVAKREIIDEYGWRNYGDVYADHENAYYPGPKPVISHYNNQFDVIYGSILQRMRTGDVAWREVFDPLARHVIDIDVYHTSDDRAAYSGGLFWLTDHYRSAETATHRTYSAKNQKPGAAYGGGPGCEHNYATGLLHYYYLTGDRQALEAVIGLADWVVALDDGSRTIFSLIDDGPTGLASATRSPDYHGPGRGAGNSINVLLDGWLATGRREYFAKAEALIRRTIHPEDDVDARGLLQVESGWSYTIHLAALARYLDLKIEQGEFDFMYAYAQASLVHYARWMAEHERPFFDHPEDLEYPTEAWAAQEFRKANALRLAARHAEEPLRARLHARGLELADRAWADLLRFESRHVARAVTILMTEGMRDAYFRTTEQPPAPRPDKSYDFGQPERFTPQRQRAKARLKTAGGLAQLVLRLTNPANWRRITRLVREYCGRGLAHFSARFARSSAHA
jgi:hypothetical protein